MLHRCLPVRSERSRNIDVARSNNLAFTQRNCEERRCLERSQVIDASPTKHAIYTWDEKFDDYGKPRPPCIQGGVFIMRNSAWIGAFALQGLASTRQSGRCGTTRSTGSN